MHHVKVIRLYSVLILFFQQNRNGDLTGGLGAGTGTEKDQMWQKVGGHSRKNKQQEPERQADLPLHLLFLLTEMPPPSTPLTLSSWSTSKVDTYSEDFLTSPARVRTSVSDLIVRSASL